MGRSERSQCVQWQWQLLAWCSVPRLRSQLNRSCRTSLACRIRRPSLAPAIVLNIGYQHLWTCLLRGPQRSTSTSDSNGTLSKARLPWPTPPGSRLDTTRSCWRPTITTSKRSLGVKTMQRASDCIRPHQAVLLRPRARSSSSPIRAALALVRCSLSLHFILQLEQIRKPCECILDSFQWELPLLLK